MINLVDPGTNAVAHTDVFFGDHFGTRQTSFDFAGFDNGITLVHALDRAGHNVFATFEEVVKDLLALGVANFLQDGLLGGLRADAAELFGLEGLFYVVAHRSEEHTSELQSLMRISYAVFCLKKK